MCVIYVISKGNQQVSLTSGMISQSHLKDRTVQMPFVGVGKLLGH